MWLNGDEFRAFVRQFAPEKLAQTCGVEAESIRDAARLYATAKPSMCFHGLGVTEHTQGTEGVMCLVKRGGLNLMEMMDAAEAGKLKALWAIGYDVLLTNANAHATERALRGLDLLIVQDMFRNETARFASVFLPAASSFEKDGTFMNAERRIQRIRKVIPPIGQAESDWEIVCHVASALGKGELFNYNSAKEIWEEIRKVWKGGAGVTYERLEDGGLQWPCLNDNDPGTEILHEKTFNIGPKAALGAFPIGPRRKQSTKSFRFCLCRKGIGFLTTFRVC